MWSCPCCSHSQHGCSPGFAWRDRGDVGTETGGEDEQGCFRAVCFWEDCSLSGGAQAPASAVGHCNDLKPISSFDKKPPRILHQGVGEGEDGDALLEVERWDMHAFLTSLVPQFKTGVHHTLQVRAADAHKLVNADVKFLLSKMIGVGFTSDGFTSDESKMHFHSLTAHGVIQIGRRVIFLSFLLADRVFPEGTADVVSSFILDELDNVWEVDETLRVGITVDGAELSMAARLKMLYWHCPAHWLNLTIHDVIQWPKCNNLKVALEELASYPSFLRQIWEIIDNAKKTVTFSSPKQLAELKRTAEKAKLEVKAFKQDVETRWSSEYILLESIMENKAAMRDFWRQRNNRDGMHLTNEDYGFIDDMLYILSCPHRIVEDIQKWAYPCGMDVWPDLFRCVEFWTVNCKDSISRDLSKRMVQHLLDATFRRASITFNSNRLLHLAMMSFHPYVWRTHGDSYVLASLVDANIDRFRTIVPELQNGKHFIDLIFDNMKGCIQRYAPSTIDGCCWGLYSRHRSKVSNSGGAGDEGPAAEPLYKKAKEALNKLWHNTSAPAPDAPGGGFSQDLSAEIKLFFRRLGELQHLPDLLAVYQTFINARECPRCVHVALRHMGMPGANAPSECVFSDTGLVTGGRRARTGADWAEMQVMIHRNHDFVKKVREMLQAQPGEALEVAWERIHSK